MNVPKPMPPTSRFGLPDLAYLKALRIWDSYLSTGGDSFESTFERLLPMIDAAGMERLYISVSDTKSRAFERWPDRLLGKLGLNANKVQESLDALNRWVRDGSATLVSFTGGAGPSALPCSHPNFEPLVQRIGELGVAIMQHTWDQTDGKGNDVGTSTPSELATLAARHPRVKFVCVHAGGEWEKGIRAVQRLPNVLVETSGFDPTAGFIEMAVRELGAERIVFGSHFPSRSLGTEYSKILNAEISERAKQLIMGENLRNLVRPLMAKKGMKV